MVPMPTMAKATTTNQKIQGNSKNNDSSKGLPKGLYFYGLMVGRAVGLAGLPSLPSLPNLLSLLGLLALRRTGIETDGAELA